VHNNSGESLSRLVLRLDHNIFRARVPRGSYVPAETTEGMVVTRLAIDGKVLDLKARRRTRGPGVFGLNKTVATIWLAKPIAPRSTAKVEIEWQASRRQHGARPPHDAALG